jgi:hypothetical protein
MTEKCHAIYPKKGTHLARATFGSDDCDERVAGVSEESRFRRKRSQQEAKEHEST